VVGEHLLLGHVSRHPTQSERGRTVPKPVGRETPIKPPW
jgi:hypothetical protein